MKILSGPPSVGDILQELYLLPTGISATEAAKLCDISPDLFLRILNNKEVIGYEIAYKLGKGFNTSYNFWLNIQKDYQDAQGNEIHP
ncbi:MAG: HigA family addiction module antitoxin [Neptuniibacter sp.]